MRHATSCAVVLVTILSAVASAQPRLVFVDDDAIGAHDGSSWQNACRYLQDALAIAGTSAKPVEIRVAQGSYYPDRGLKLYRGDYSSSFTLLNSVVVRGGYAGRGTADPNARDIGVYVSVLSGDNYGDDGPEPESRCNNASHVVTAGGTDATAVLDGFTITGGNAFWGDKSAQGSGMLDEGGSPTILNCTFTGNDAGFGHSPRSPYSGAPALGGAVYVHAGSPQFVGCTFTANSADYGGAVCCEECDVTFEKCTFQANWAYVSGAVDGLKCKLTLTDCTFTDNEARNDLFWGGEGAGMSSYEGDVRLVRCRFTGNRALSYSGSNNGPVLSRGGAVCSGADRRLELRECVFTANCAGTGAAVSTGCRELSLVNCLATGNVCTLGGGTVVAQIITSEGAAAPQWNMTVTNCTFAGNRAPAGRALAFDPWERSAPGAVRITNCILWDGGDEILNGDSSAVTVSHSDLTGGWKGDENIGKDPLFNAPGYWDSNSTPDDSNDDVWVDGDYHLPGGSPCLDRGDDSTADGVTDLDGNPRIVNETVDMGAYERQAQAVIFVDDDATGENDGSSWANAYRYLQDALAAAKTIEKPLEIRVARGTYKPDQGAVGVIDPCIPDWRYWAAFKLVSGVTIRGGYAGVTDAVPDRRDIRAYETVLTGDLDGNDVPVRDPKILSAYLPDTCRWDNCAIVVDSRQANRTGVLEGVTVAGGDQQGYIDPDWIGDPVGGGVQGGSPTLRMCTFRDNITRYDGAAVCADRPLITDCLFVRNIAGRLGGAVCARGTLVGCTFIDNHAEYGGAVASPKGIVDIANCLFVQNSVLSSYLWDDWPPAGGAIFVAQGRKAWYGVYGGGANVTNCTFFANQAVQGLAIYNDQCKVSVLNCIFRGGPQPVWETPGTTTQVRYSDIEGGWPGEGNIDADPLFAALGRWDLNGTPDDPNDDRWIDGDYHLKSQAGRRVAASGNWVADSVISPCIDSGDPNSPVGDEPQPNGGRINMGFYGGTTEASKSWR